MKGNDSYVNISKDEVVELLNTYTTVQEEFDVETDKKYAEHCEWWEGLFGDDLYINETIIKALHKYIENITPMVDVTITKRISVGKKWFGLLDVWEYIEVPTGDKMVDPRFKLSEYCHKLRDLIFEYFNIHLLYQINGKYSCYMQDINYIVRIDNVCFLVEMSKSYKKERGDFMTKSLKNQINYLQKLLDTNKDSFIIPVSEYNKLKEV